MYTHLTITFAIATCLSTACVADSHLENSEDRIALGKADRVGTCAADEGNYCGTKSLGTCWCDDLCESYGDCCDDKTETCDCQPATCEDAGAECGQADDGCGGTLECGECPATPLWTPGWGGAADARYIARFWGDERGYGLGRERWGCHVLPAKPTITCDTSDGSGALIITATIQDDGSFQASLNGGANMHGTVHPNRAVTIESIRTVDVQFGGGHKRLSPMDSYEVLPACWHPGTTFPSGGWVAGYWTTDCP